MKKKDARKERALKTLKQAGAITREKHGSIPAPQVFKDRKKDTAKYCCRGKVNF